MVVHNRRWLVLLLMAMVPLHVDRFKPFLGLYGAVGFNFWRTCGAETVVQLVLALYFVQFRSGGGKRWPDGHGLGGRPELASWAVRDTLLYELYETLCSLNSDVDVGIVCE